MRLIPDHILGIVTVLQEAEGEPYEGKVAVAEVILRRTKRKFMSDGTVTGTVLRRLQFSGWNEDAANRIRSLKADTDDPLVRDCLKAWADAEAGSNLAPDCLNYYNPSLCDPPWARGAKIIAEIGAHRFVIPKEGT
jgi:N-acetylmuramoyl-L-alanine amidase